MTNAPINDEKQSHGHISSLYCWQVRLPAGSKILIHSLFRLEEKKCDIH